VERLLPILWRVDLFSRGNSLKIAVTGASGFIGRTLCAALVEGGHEVRSLRLRPGGPAADLAGAHAVVHLGALVHKRGAPSSEFRQSNVELTSLLGRSAAVAGARMIFLSSVKVHGEHSSAPLTESAPLAPADDYARSKADAEAMLRAIGGLQLVVLRPPLVYGPGVKANFLMLMRAIASGIPLPLALVSNRRSFLYAGNLVDAILCAIADSRPVGRTYLVCDGPALSTPALCRASGAALGRPARLFPFPSSWLPGPLARSLHVDDSALRTELGWRPPFSLESALRATAAWYRTR
jgi:nucleoside-diphosphate-sugar epimerase